MEAQSEHDRKQRKTTERMQACVHLVIGDVFFPQQTGKKANSATVQQWLLESFLEGKWKVNLELVAPVGAMQVSD